MSAKFNKTSYLNIAYEATFRDYMMPPMFQNGLKLRYMIMLWYEVSMKIIMRFIKESNMFLSHNMAFVVAREVVPHGMSNERIYARIFTVLAKNAAHILMEHNAYNHNRVVIRGSKLDKPVFKGNTFEILHDAGQFIIFTTFLALHRVEHYNDNDVEANADFLNNTMRAFKRMTPSVMKQWGSK